VLEQIHSTKTLHETSNSTQKPNTTSINDKKYYSQIRANPLNKNTSRNIKSNFTKHQIQLKTKHQIFNSKAKDNKHQ